MKRAHLSVLLFAAGCASSSSTTGAPKTEVTLVAPLAPSAVERLGVKESVSGMGESGERVVRSATDRIAACLKPLLEREPSLRGELGFVVEVGARITATRSSSALAELPAARCIEGALANAALPPGVSGKARYTLTFIGKYEPAPLREGVEVFSQWIGRDWSSPAGQVPEGVEKVQEALHEPIRRCGFGAEPEMNEQLWLVLRVGKGGVVTVGPSANGESASCIRRVVGAASFPDAGHDYALSVLLRPESAVLQPTADADGEGQELGMIGLLNSGSGAGTGRALANPNGGSFWGDEIPESYGFGGLGVTGSGGLVMSGEGLGTIGRSNPGTGPGFGGTGRLGGKRTKPPSVRMGKSSVSPGLPPEIIQRIVRQNFGRFRLCYEQALRKSPKLAGTVTVKFDIDRSGSVSKVSSSTDMPDKSVSSCVERGFYNLSFPEPEGRVVKVTYPIKFKPSDDAPDPVSPAPKEPEPATEQTINGKPVSQVKLADVEQRLLERSFQVAGVPGFGKGETPVLFVRDESRSRVFAVTLGPVTSDEGFTCVVGKPEHMLRIHGEGCQRVLSPILD